MKEYMSLGKKDLMSACVLQENIVLLPTEVLTADLTTA